jgi:crooked neck
MCPGKENVLKGYIALERQLGEIDRCRKIYARYIETLPHNSRAWVQFAQLEVDVGEIGRAR